MYSLTCFLLSYSGARGVLPGCGRHGGQDGTAGSGSHRVRHAVLLGRGRLGATHYLQLTTYNLLLTTCYLLLATHRLGATCCLLLATYYLHFLLAGWRTAQCYRMSSSVLDVVREPLFFPATSQHHLHPGAAAACRCAESAGAKARRDPEVVEQRVQHLTSTTPELPLSLVDSALLTLNRRKRQRRGLGWHTRPWRSGPHSPQAQRSAETWELCAISFGKGRRVRQGG